MFRDVANGFDFGRVRVISRRFAAVRDLGGIFESYRRAPSVATPRNCGSEVRGFERGAQR